MHKRRRAEYGGRRARKILKRGSLSGRYATATVKATDPYKPEASMILTGTVDVMRAIKEPLTDTSGAKQSTRDAGKGGILGGGIGAVNFACLRLSVEVTDEKRLATSPVKKGCMTRHQKTSLGRQ